MTSGINFWDHEIWSFIVVLGLIFGAMLVGNMLRRLIKPLRESLLPGSVLGGFILLGVSALWKEIVGTPMIDVSTLEALTYHCLGLGVVALAFKTSEKQKEKNVRRDIFNTGIITVSTYLVQAILGLIISVVLFYLIGSFAGSGLLLPMGFGQGPGQALIWGKNYENYTETPAFEGGASFGLSVAAMGFVVASIGGVIYLNYMKRKGRVKQWIINPDEAEDLSAEMITTKGEIPLSESLDKMTIQCGLVFLAYALAYLFLWGVTEIFSGIPFFENTVKSLIWGFNFIFGMLFVFVIKWILNIGTKCGLRKREYTNNFMLSRISGITFDIMVVASIAAIDLSAFSSAEFVLPLILMCGLGAVVTFVYVKFVCNKLFKEYADDEFMVMYGMLTGTLSTGLILLREIDPLFESRASSNAIYQNIWAILFGFPMLLLMGFGALGIKNTLITLAFLIVFMIVMQMILFRRQIFLKKKDK